MAQIKGTGMLHVVKALRQQHQAARERLDPDLLPYLEHNIEVDSGYPAEDFQRLLAALVTLVPATIDDPWAWLGERGAAWDLTEIYSQTVPHGDVWGMIQRLPALWKLYYDSGELVAELEAPRRASLELHGFPHTHPDYCRHLAGYFGAALDLAGAKRREVELLACSQEPSRARWSVVWE